MAEFLISGPRLFNSIISRDEDDDETGNRRKGKTVREKPGAKEEFATSLSLSGNGQRMDGKSNFREYPLGRQAGRRPKIELKVEFNYG